MLFRNKDRNINIMQPYTLCKRKLKYYLFWIGVWRYIHKALKIHIKLVTIKTAGFNIGKGICFYMCSEGCTAYISSITVTSKITVPCSQHTQSQPLSFQCIQSYGCLFHRLSYTLVFYTLQTSLICRDISAGHDGAGLIMCFCNKNKLVHKLQQVIS